MEDNREYGFFDQLPVAFFQPEKYKEFLNIKRKKRYVAGFTFIIVALIFLMTYIMPFVAWNSSVGGVENVILHDLPEFKLANGTFQIAEPLDFELTSTVHIKADSSVEAFSEKDLDDKYPQEFLISKNNLIMTDPLGTREIKFSSIPNQKADNQTLVDFLPTLKTILLWSLGIVYIMEYVKYLLIAMFFAFMCKIGIRSPEGKTVRFKEAFQFAIYGRAFFALLACVNAAMGYPLSALYATVVEVYFCIRWIMRAERSYLGIEKKILFKRGDKN